MTWGRWSPTGRSLCASEEPGLPASLETAGPEARVLKMVDRTVVPSGRVVAAHSWLLCQPDTLVRRWD